MLRDANFFNSRISKLDGAADLGDYLVKIVVGKSVTAISSSPDIEASDDKAEASGEKS